MSIKIQDDGQNFVINRSAIPSRAAKQLKSLSQLFAAEQRRLFVKKLFSGEAMPFEQLCNTLEPAADWREAHRILEEYWKTYRINPMQKEAKLLSDLVYKRYFPNEALA